MDNANLTVDAERVAFRPPVGTGWETVLNHMDREITMQFRVLGLRLLLKRRLPYSEVVRIGSVSKSRPSLRGRLFTRKALIPGVDDGTARMGELDFVFDITATVRGGKTIKLGRLKSAEAAADIEGQLRQRLGLSETF